LIRQVACASCDSFWGANMFADLHIRSNYYDGTNTPKEIVELAKRNNAFAVALCDHDTVEGFPEFIS